MTDVLLIYPSVSYTAKYEEIKDDIFLDHPPIGMLYIAATLEKAGFSVKVYDTSGDWWKLEKMMEIIRKEKPKVIGFSCLTSNIRGACQLASEIKKEHGGRIKIGLGGHHISCDPGILERYPEFDFGVTGESDITFPRLVDEIINQKKGVKGLFIGENPEDLDILPIPARHLCDFSRYKNFYLNSIVSTRGCPYGCSFCSRPAVSKRTRVRDPKLVVDEIKQTVEITGKKDFMFLDDSFTINKKNTIELCNELIGSKTKIKFNAMTRVNLVDKDLLRLMKRAGCNKLMFGVESGNTRVRNDIVKKAVSEEQIKTAFDLCRKIGIEADMFLMIGFPTETKKDIQDTISFPLKKVKTANMIGVHITVPLPGSIIWEKAIEEDKIPPDLIDKYINGELGQGFRNIWPRYTPKGMTPEYLVEARNLANKKFYFRPRYVFYRALKDLKSPAQLKQDVREFFSLFFHGRSSWGE